MSNDKKDSNKVLHEYDGIQELDNQLPRWWLATFYITIVFAVIYFVHYQMGTGESIKEEFAGDMAKIELARLSKGGGGDFPIQAELEKSLKNPDSLKLGKDVFNLRCVSCHADHGQGLIGPNLTDNYWIHGDGSPKEIAKTVYVGVPDKGMPPWGALLKADEIYALTAYIQSLRGGNYSGAKAPQGNLIK